MQFFFDQVLANSIHLCCDQIFNCQTPFFFSNATDAVIHVCMEIMLKSKRT